MPPPIVVDNPFAFSYSGTAAGDGLSNSWGAGQNDDTGGNTGRGGQDTFDGLNVGTSNTADNFGDLLTGGGGGGAFDSNGGTGNGNGGLLGDPTIVNTAVGKNAAFVGDNTYTGFGSIGLFGRSRGAGTIANNPGTVPRPTDTNDPSKTNDWSIGVLGQSSKGCGIYGLATDDNPTVTEPSRGIGVVGRSVGGDAVEDTSVEQIMGFVAPSVPATANDGAIGVLGHSKNGPGVRGHGGPLSRNLAPVTTSVEADPGGVFSSGQRLYVNLGIPAVSFVPQEVSHDSCAQLRLVPSIGAKLPQLGRIGDLFMSLPNFTPGQQIPAQLWVCTGIDSSGKNPVLEWQQVQFTTSGPLKGGSPIP
jgi:hypothetical protein